MNMTKAEIKEEAMKREQSADFSVLFSVFEKMSEFNGVSSAYGMGFCHGAMWARREGWISVKDRLPEVFDGDLFRSSEKQMKTVLTTNGHGSIVPNVWNGYQWEYYGDVAFWMPMPALPRLVEK